MQHFDEVNRLSPAISAPDTTIPQRSAGVRLLDEDLAEKRTDELRRAAGLFLGYCPPSEEYGTYRVNGKDFNFEGSKSTLYRVGSQFFFSVEEIWKNHVMTREAGEHLEGDVDGWVKRYQDAVHSVDPTIAGNFSYIYPSSAVMRCPLNDHSAGMVACMSAFQEFFPGALVLDLGCGPGPLGGPALSLGAARLLAIDSEEKAVRYNSALLKASGWKEGRAAHDGKFQCICRDFNDESLQLKALASEFSHTIVLANIGAWDHYGDANRQALTVALGLPNLKLILNGGWCFSPGAEHQAAFDQEKKWLKQNSSLEIKDFSSSLNVGVIVAAKR